MPIVPSAPVHQGQLEAEIKSAIQTLGPEAVHVVYNIGEDSTGDPSIFFRIVIADSAFHEETIADLTWAISSTITDRLQPIENWGLHPYFNFRSEADHQAHPARAWTINGIPR